MRWTYSRVILCVVLLAAVVTTTVLAVGTGRRDRPQRLMNVGGSTNPCTCTQRLER